MSVTTCQSCGVIDHKCQCGAMMKGQPSPRLLNADAMQQGFQVVSERAYELARIQLRPATQSRVDSAIEVAVNIAIGATVSLAAQVAIFPAYGIHASAGQHLGIVGWFTVVSVARQYFLRRAFNGKSPYRYFREKFSD